MSLPEAYRKRSFLEFDLAIGLGALIEEYRHIPREAWLSSYWGQSHCSVGMFLLRGGDQGSEDDFWTVDDAKDHPLLLSMPAVAALLNGPFGRARYAFLFRMRPWGVTLRHRDRAPVWQTMYRIHIPLVTNPDAFLISGQRSLHLSAGRAWTFDNHDEHGVVNGAQERVHLIFDVPFNESLRQRIDEATFHSGECVPAHLERISAQEIYGTTSYPGDRAIGALVAHHRQAGLSDDEISRRLNLERVPTRQYLAEAAGQAPGWTPAMIAAIGSGSMSGKIEPDR